MHRGSGATSNNLTAVLLQQPARPHHDLVTPLLRCHVRHFILCCARSAGVVGLYETVMGWTNVPHHKRLALTGTESNCTQAQVGGLRMADIKKIIARVLSDYPEIEVALLFGSAARDRLTPGSDVDIAVAASDPLPLGRRCELTLSLSAALGREVDLVDLQAISGPLLQVALCEGVVVKKTSALIFAELLKKMLYNQEDMMPNYRMILEARSRRFANGKNHRSGQA